MSPSQSNQPNKNHFFAEAVKKGHVDVVELVIDQVR